ncbi:MAG: hypothetical protein LBT52_06615 [Clostridiales Family XIII bacterium]|jgi:hypothetical protein|nr:hypothetical protein [Clostridiales Family XIII bacterium]
MKRLLKINLVTDDTVYAEAFTEAVAATQHGFSVSVMKPSCYHGGMAGAHSTQEKSAALLPDEGCVHLVDSSGLGSSSGSGSSNGSRDTECIGRTSGGDGGMGDTGCSGDTDDANGTGCIGDIDDARNFGGAGGFGHGAKLTIVVDGASAPVGAVGKYAGCGRICGEARAAYAASHDLSDPSAGKDIGQHTVMISLIGLEGGAGASSVALGLAGELAAYRGKKTMYMSFETFESPRLGVGTRMTGCKEVSVFMFQFLRSIEKGGAPVSAEPYLSRDDYGTIRFMPSDGFNRLRELSGSRLDRFIAAAAAEVQPDILVLDWGACVGADTAEWLRASAHTVMIGRHEGVKSCTGDNRSAFTRIAEELGIDSRKAAFVINRQPPEEIDALQDRCVGISEDAYAFERDGDHIAISLATAFGTGIKELADTLLSADENSADAAAAYLSEGDDHVRYAA